MIVHVLWEAFSQDDQITSLFGIWIQLAIFLSLHAKLSPIHPTNTKQLDGSLNNCYFVMLTNKIDLNMAMLFTSSSLYSYPCSSFYAFCSCPFFPCCCCCCCCCCCWSSPCSFFFFWVAKTWAQNCVLQILQTLQGRLWPCHTSRVTENKARGELVVNVWAYRS